MIRILKPIFVFPMLAGLVAFFMTFLVFWHRPKDKTLFKDLSATSLPQGRMINLQTNQDDYEKLRKGKVLLVFLTRGCNACKREILNVSQASRTLVPRVAVYGVFLEDRGEVDRFVQENRIEFPVLLDVGGRIFGSLGITLIPAKVLIEDGKITRTWFGSSPSKSALIKDVGEVERQ